MSSKIRISRSTGSFSDELQRLNTALREADAVVIGGGAGLSTAAGFVYGGERFSRWFGDFAEKYDLGDEYAAGFYPYPTKEEFWAFWSRNIYINRYLDPPGSVYRDLHSLVKDKNYFVLTTNVDHCFQKAGFDKERLFYTQGDYGLLQCSKPCHQATYDNERMVRDMLAAQGFETGPDGTFRPPAEGKPEMSVPTALLPCCPRCGEPMTLNLRSDEKFVEDEGWHRAADRYAAFLESLSGRVLFWEIGVGFNTPEIIKYPFWRMTAEKPESVYVCMNQNDAFCPEAIADRSICLEGDCAEAISYLCALERSPRVL